VPQVFTSNYTPGNEHGIFQYVENIYISGFLLEKEICILCASSHYFYVRIDAMYKIIFTVYKRSFIFVDFTFNHETNYTSIKVPTEKINTYFEFLHVFHSKA
jgi:hypothetical protein